MMYSEKLVTALKSGGKILREFKDTVYVPFGSEYSLLIKNLNSVRCLVNVQIDGTDISDGVQFIVPAKGEIELERFMKNKNMQSGNRFKFIERSAKIEQHRGVQAEDGLVRIEFEFERLPIAISNTPVDWFKQYPPGVRTPDYFGPKLGGNTGDWTPRFGEIMCNAGSDQLARGLSQNFSATATVAANATMVNQVTLDLNDVGITVPGSVSDQKFTQGTWFATDGVKHVMVLKLLGEFGQQKIQKPITVKTKPTCTSCGKVNKATAKFCSECGTGLQLV